MPSFSGRTRENVPLTGYLPRTEVRVFIDECVRDGWRRVAVGEGITILAAYQEGHKAWLHPELEGAA